MTKGESPKLLLAELEEIFVEIAKLKGIALETRGGDVDANYALVGYFFNLRITTENLAYLASALSQSEGIHQEASDFLNTTEEVKPTEVYLAFKDLTDAHQKLDTQLRSVFTAYQDVLENNKPLAVWAGVAERYWGLATSQLSLARERYYAK